MQSFALHLSRTIRRAVWLVTTTVLLAVHASHVSAIAAQVPGDLDLSFAGGAGTITSLTIGGGTHDRLTAMAMQPDGKMLLAGYCDGLNSQQHRLGQDPALGWQRCAGFQPSLSTQKSYNIR